MKLFACLDIARACGLEDLAGAYLNVNYHATQTFAYDEINKEMTELIEDYCKYGFAAEEKNEKGEVVYNFTCPDLSIHAALDKINEVDGTSLTFTDFEESMGESA